MNVSMFFDLEHLAAPAGIQYLLVAASNEKPAATVSQAGVFVAQASAGRADLRLVAGFAADDVAEQLPFFALEAHQLKLLDRREVGG